MRSVSEDGVSATAVSGKKASLPGFLTNGMGVIVGGKLAVIRPGVAFRSALHSRGFVLSSGWDDEVLMPDRFHVAITFAGTQREYAERVFRELQSYCVSAFIDSDRQPEIWGKDLAEYFGRIFAQESTYVLMLMSQDYIDREWCRHERRFAITKMLREKDEVILPIRFDDSWPDGIPSTIAWLPSSTTPEVVGHLICQKLGINTADRKMSDAPLPRSVGTTGTVTLNYSNNNGRYILGVPPYNFETAWSRNNQSTITAHNDPPSISGVAVPDGLVDPSGLADVGKFDFSSRSRRPRIGEFVVIKNSNGFFAVLQIIKILSKEHGNTRDELTFTYVIRDDKGVDFSDLFDESEKPPWTPVNVVMRSDNPREIDIEREDVLLTLKTLGALVLVPRDQSDDSSVLRVLIRTESLQHVYRELRRHHSDRIRIVEKY